jgi:hypothetical protein
MIMALDAISTPTIVDEIPFKGRVFWSINGYDTDASTAIEIKAAPGAGKSLYLTEIVIGSDDADAHPQLQDEDATVIFGPLLSSTGGMHLVAVLRHPIKLTANKALALKAAAAGNVFVFVEGATADD